MATPKIERVKNASFRQFLHSLTSWNNFFDSISTKTQLKGDFPILPRNPELTPLEESIWPHPKSTVLKSAFLTFLALFNIAKKFSLLDLEKNRSIKDFTILPKNHGLTPLEKSNMATPKTWLNLSKTRLSGNFPLFNFVKHLFRLHFLEKRFFVQEYSKTHFPGLYSLKKIN